MKARERKLLSFFLLLLVAGGTAVLVDIYRQKARDLDRERRDLDLALVEIDALLEEKETWVKRDEWVRGNQPAFTGSQEADNQIFEEANAKGAPGVEVSGIKLLEPVETEYYSQAGASLTVTGSLDSVFRWVHSMHRPEAFRVVRNLRVVPDSANPSSIQCSLELVRWYAPREL